MICQSHYQCEGCSQAQDAHLCRLFTFRFPVPPSLGYATRPIGKMVARGARQGNRNVQFFRKAPVRPRCATAFPALRPLSLLFYCVIVCFTTVNSAFDLSPIEAAAGDCRRCHRHCFCYRGWVHWRPPLARTVHVITQQSTVTETDTAAIEH